MADPEPEVRAFVVTPDRTPAPLANLAQRTLDSMRVPESGLAVPRQLTVSADGSAMFRTIGAALALAVDGDEILVRPGEYRESLIVDKSVRIRGDGPREKIVVRPDRGESGITIIASAPNLVGFTVNGLDPAEPDDSPGADLVRITGGTPVLESLDICGGDACVSVRGNEIMGAIRLCWVHDGRYSGILIAGGASPRIEENEIWAHASSGVAVEDSESNPTVRANRIHDCDEHGIQVAEGAAPRIEENEIWSNGGAQVVVQGTGTDPIIQANRIHDGAWGVVVQEGACPRTEENEIWGNALEGIYVTGIGTSPVVVGNIVRDGLDDGIYVLEGATPSIFNNTILDNALSAIRVDEDARPVVDSNVIRE